MNSQLMTQLEEQDKDLKDLQAQLKKARQASSDDLSNSLEAANQKLEQKNNENRELK
jgi:hypothetical protein